MDSDKKELGIITFNRAFNYGAVLQAYALKSVCEKLGYNVHIINYTKGVKDDNPTPFRDFLESSNKKRASIKLCRSILGYFWDKKRWKNFVLFREKYLSESKFCDTHKDLRNLGYDKYIIGSDQIWNYRITGDQFDPAYFGNFSDKDNCIIYAASAHDTPFPLDKELELKQLLMSTSAKISIREEKLEEYVHDLTGREYPVVLDPTLLAGRKIMERIVDSNVSKKDYILMYQIDSNPLSDISVKTLEKRFNCKVYTMTAPRVGKFHGRKGTVGPEKFLALLKNAKFLVTNSFHGIALSLIFEKQFYVYENNGVMSRIDNLLSILELKNRKVKMVSDIDINNKIDYIPVKQHLLELRKYSMEFLKNALEGKEISVTQKESKNQSLLKMEERKKGDCSGCSACANICPVNAITMEFDDEGFLYPKINQKTCIHCGKCDQVCSFLPVHKKEELPRAFGVKHKDEKTRITSRSGAAFVAFTNVLLHENGVIYGAAMQKDQSVVHIRAVCEKERDRMKGAKYVQSDITDIYKQLAKDLKDGKKVLFSGTPCQVAGIKTFLSSMHINDENLYTCDLICHGVPSPKLWKDYTKYIEKRYHSKILVSNFRDKSFGWDSHCESFVLKNGKKIVSRDYTDLFYEHIMLRPSCHNCYFANINRISDLTLGDFWGIEKNNPEFNDNKGVSLILVNTQKGQELFERSSNELEYFECDVKNCIQPTLVKPSSMSARRKEFWQDYNIMKFSDFLKKYTRPVSKVQRVKRNIKQVMYKTGMRKHP